MRKTLEMFSKLLVPLLFITPALAFVYNQTIHLIDGRSHDGLMADGSFEYFWYLTYLDHVTIKTAVSESAKMMPMNSGKELVFSNLVVSSYTE